MSVNFDVNYYKQKYLFGKSNKELAELLRYIAYSLELKKQDYFRIIAYKNAADALESYPVEIYDLIKNNEDFEIENIGKIIKQKLIEYCKNGYSLEIAEILSGIPITVFLLTKVRSIGPKKAYRLVETFKLYNPDTVYEDLLTIAQQGKIKVLEGFGAKSEESIIKAIQTYLSFSKQSRILLSEADKIAGAIIKWLKKLDSIEKIDVLGSIRRRYETVGDIDIAVVSKNNQKIIDHFVNYPNKVKIENAGTNKASIILKNNIRVDIRIAEKSKYGSMLQYFTGNKIHNINLREHALRLGYSLSEYGLKDIKNNRLIYFSDEKDLYHFLKLQYIPPEIREGNEEIEKALVNNLPNLITASDIKGDLHIHSNFNTKTIYDLGVSSLEEIITKAINLGYSYIGIADHNPQHSLSEQEVKKILTERRRFYDQIIYSKNIEQFKVFIAIECDILPNGELAIPHSCIEYLDYLIISVHSSFEQDKDTMTKRLVKALEYPNVRILAHPTGRLINKRPAITADWDKVLSVCKTKDIAVEINSNPLRLDLPFELIKKYKSKGVKFIINTDAHDCQSMEFLKYGVDIAKKGWLTKDDVVNTKSLDKIDLWLTGKK